MAHWLATCSLEREEHNLSFALSYTYVRILSRSSRKCTVTGIDSHELQALDVVQSAALVETNHGIVNIIMNEYACFGKGHTIHSSGQIVWFKNLS